jgi:hypothetical protein
MMKASECAIRGMEHDIECCRIHLENPIGIHNPFPRDD